jgi:hypothetical protein
LRKFLKMKLLFTNIFCFLGCLIFAQNNKVDDYLLHIKKTTQTIEIDGNIEDEDWNDIVAVKDFRKAFPIDTGYSKWPTEVKVTFDDKNIYVAAKCFQKRAEYTVQSLKRDFVGGTSDVINIIFDPSKDGLNGFLFGLSPLGVQRECLVSNGDVLSFEWDNKWSGAVQNFDDYWTAEMAIPFKTLRYSVASGPNTWGLNFVRTYLKDWEVSTWFPVARQFRPNNVAFCGSLVWDEAPPKTGRNIAVIPYVSGGYAVDYQRNSNLELTAKPGSFRKGLGGDAKISVTPSLNLDLTINPDFSQVEVDQQVANLSRFELFFPERRQFFLENRDLFAMFGFPSTRPFFSRRVGLAYNTVKFQNETVPILAGARLSGKLNDNWRIGLLNMQTKRKDWNEKNLQPAANFTVATVQRKTFDRSTLSAILVNKQNFLGNLTEGQKYQRIGSDSFAFQPWNRVAGLEYNLYSKDNRWEGEWYYHRSFSPDKNKQGQTLASFLGYRDRRFNARMGYFQVDKHYDSESGFVPRRSVQGIYPGVGFNFYPSIKRISVLKLSVDGDLTYNLAGKQTDRDLFYNFSVESLKQTVLTVGFYNTYTYLLNDFDPTNLYKSGTLPLPKLTDYNYGGFRADLMTSSTYNLQLQSKIQIGRFFNGNISTFQGLLSYRVQPVGLFSLGYSYNRIRLPAPYASATVLLLGPKAELSFTKTLSASAFFQYNTQANNFNINARVQWRFAPVSDMFLVYTDNSFADEIANTKVRFLTPKNRAFVFKVVYWLNV